MTVTIISLFDIKLFSIPLINDGRKFIVVLTVARDSFLSRATWKLSNFPKPVFCRWISIPYSIFQWGFSNKISGHKCLWLNSFPLRATFPVYVTLVNFIVQITFNEAYILSSLCDSFSSSLFVFHPSYVQILCWTYSFWMKTNWYSNSDYRHWLFNLLSRSFLVN